MRLQTEAVKTFAESTLLKKTFHRFVKKLAGCREFILDRKALANKQHCIFAIIKNACRLRVNQRHIFICRRKSYAVLQLFDILIKITQGIAFDAMRFYMVFYNFA